MLRVVFLILTLAKIAKSDVRPVKGLDQTPHRADFDALVDEFVAEESKRVGVRVAKYDAYGELEEIKNNTKYHKYHVSCKLQNIAWLEPLEDEIKTGYSTTKWIHNGGSNKIDHDFSRETQFMNAFTWEVTNSVKIETGGSFSIGIPSLFQIDIGGGVGISPSETKAKSMTKSEALEITEKFEVHPNKSMKVEYIISSREVVIPWEGEAIISGWIALYFEKKVNGEKLEFRPVQDLARREFKLHPEGLSVRIGGIFKGIAKQDDSIVYSEYPLRPKDSLEFGFV